MNVSQDQVARYLQDHPEFFAQRGDLLTQLTVPNPYGDQAISLGERQLQVLREKLRTLEGQMREMIRYAEGNDALSDKVYSLAEKLNAARNLEAVLQTAYHDLRERFAVPHVALRIWGTVLSPDQPECAPVSPDLEQKVAALNGPRCGTEIPAEVRGWFSGVGVQLGSFALLPFGVTGGTDSQGGVRGLLVLGSEDVHRFYPEMGVFYLGWIARQLGAAIARHF